MSLVCNLKPKKCFLLLKETRFLCQRLCQTTAMHSASNELQHITQLLLSRNHVSLQPLGPKLQVKKTPSPFGALSKQKVQQCMTIFADAWEWDSSSVGAAESNRLTEQNTLIWTANDLNIYFYTGFVIVWKKTDLEKEAYKQKRTLFQSCITSCFLLNCLQLMNLAKYSLTKYFLNKAAQSVGCVLQKRGIVHIWVE